MSSRSRALPADPLTQPCPCGRLDARRRPLSHGGCCAPYLADWAGHPAPDAESLMRSRYSAFVLLREDYLRATWDLSLIHI